MKKARPAKIQREIAGHTAAAPGLIQLKVNALEDADVTQALYRASQSGVHIDLIVRDTCRVRPGITGVSDNVWDGRNCAWCSTRNSQPTSTRGKCSLTERIVAALQRGRVLGR